MGSYKWVISKVTIVIIHIRAHEPPSSRLGFRALDFGLRAARVRVLVIGFTVFRV